MGAGPAPGADWFRVESIAPGISRVEEPWVHGLLRANMWHVRGRERDLVVDAGLGVVSLREHLPSLFEHDPILVVTHAHLDHVGAAHEFDDRRMHAACEIDGALAASLRGPELARLMGQEWALPELLVEALPMPTYEVDEYAITAAPATTELNEGDVIDLGDRQLRVLHLPGHTPGCVCLYDESDAALFSGDVIYDGELLDQLHESDIAAYVHTMRRLRSLEIEVVYPGHGDPFGGERMRDIIDGYLRSRAQQPR
ncbi:MBL fold metallo-hydrolase [Nocardioides carbamazepini]|uniref:MBL fold metallo-hydrolase n=1 Tax=Nocardioides carbamazepini TaxID=2854259 RepID=UPI00214A307C|nr:MBL fold metallo-hydrolase [Nocardioides carbamazepini]MCR1783812.1 MBL fold metallo-hydrolase [Nocardioides carbamazepini]